MIEIEIGWASRPNADEHAGPPNGPEARAPIRPSPLRCAKCGGPRALGSASRCGKCYFSKRSDAKARKRVFREEKERIVYRLRAPLVERFEAAHTASDLLALGPAPAMGKSTRWLQLEDRALRILAAAGTDVTRASVSLGRSASSLAHRARVLGCLPKDWRGPLNYGPSVKRLDLAFPYIQTARPEHADLLRVNELVPKSFPEWQRADICQSILLALFEKTVTMGELEAHKDKPRWFIKEYYKKQQPWQEVLGLGNADDERSYEDIAASRKEVASMSLKRFTDATQIEDTFQAQVAAHQKRAHAAGRFLTLEEASWDLEMNKGE